ncbi:MAG: VOC family protein [Jatrophihabitantaceae bacterium]
MPDPLDVLRTAAVPIAPDPDFAARLRARIESALALPRGVVPMAVTTAPVRTGALAPYLAVADARAALEWYADVFGAVRRGDPIVMPDGRIGHAELDLGDARIFLADAHPEIGVVAPEPGSGATVTLHLEVDDVDVVIARASAASARVERAPSDNPYGRTGVIRDPFGHRWMLNGPVVAVTQSGDVGYFALWVDDVDRAAAFYTAVLGWAYAEEAAPRQTVVGAAFRTEIVALAEMRSAAWPDRTAPTAFCARQVDDLDAAVARIRAAGGTSQPGHRGVLDCADDQGTPFSIFAGERAGAGDAIAYLTVEVPSVDAAAAFYESVFGWSFRPGTHPDGRQVDGPTPMTGFAGGAVEPGIVAMFSVDDIDAAVARVRAAGGTATDPQRQPYGTTSSCTDDQGMRFYLGELG